MSGRALNRLNHTKITKLKMPGLYEDGGGLRLVVGPNLTKRWVLRVTINGKRRERGLGSFPTVSLDAARTQARAFRTAARQGQDFAAELKKVKLVNERTFQVTFDEFFAIRRQTLSNAKHIAQWQSTIEAYAYPHIGKMAVADIRAADVIRVLEPIWFSKPETAKRVLQRMEAVFKSAILRGHRELASPCIGVSQELGTRHRVVKHHASLTWPDLPTFMDLLSLRGASSAPLALQFLILTASRSGEVRGMTWAEVDQDAGLWTVPPERMKMRTGHAVPLTTQMHHVLSAAKAAHGQTAFVFPNRLGARLSDMTLLKIVRDLGYGGKATPHGFRATFKTWAAECARARDEVSEAALAHAVAGKVRAAYLRSDFLDERRELMRMWNNYVISRPRDGATPMRTENVLVGL